MKSLLIALALLLGACASTPTQISGAPAASIPISPTSVLGTDLQSASYNLDMAVQVGALTADDPAPKCLHAVLQKAGLEPVPGAAAPASFAPKNDGIASAGAIAYIIVQQAKRAVPVQVDPQCEALVGRIAIDGATAVNKALPSILLPKL